MNISATQPPYEGVLNTCDHFANFSMQDTVMQNSGGVKLQRTDSLRVLVKKMFSESGIWQGKILANGVCFAKAFSRQNFAVYGNKYFNWSSNQIIFRMAQQLVQMRKKTIFSLHVQVPSQMMSYIHCTLEIHNYKL